MGIRNVLVEGVSCTGKTSVCQELRRRGYHAIDGDRELAYQGDTAPGRATGNHEHDHHVWDVDKVRSIAAGRDEEVTFFCGGSRNFPAFVDVFDVVLVLEIDRDTLHRRLDRRRGDVFGATPEERALVERLHRTREDVPQAGVVIDATAPLDRVVDEIVRRSISPRRTS